MFAKKPTVYIFGTWRARSRPMLTHAPTKTCQNANDMIAEYHQYQDATADDHDEFDDDDE